MSSNSASKRPASLAARLSRWYAFSSFFLVLIVTGLLYWALIRNFDQQNERYLAEKAAILRTLLEDAQSRNATVKWEVEEELAAHPSIRILSRVVSENGRVLFETDGMSRELPASTVFEPGKAVRSATGRVFHVLSSTVNDRTGRDRYSIQVAMDQSYQQDLLARYRNQLWLALGAGLMVSLLVGHRMARQGIRPVSEMAAAVQRIRSNTLDERIRLEKLPSELAALADAFNETLNRLEDAFGRLSQFSSDIAHELRTPINNICGEMEVALSRARSSGEYREVIESSLEEGKRLSRLIDSLLFLARAEHPETEIRRETLDLRRELETLLDFYEPAATERGIELVLRIPECLHAALDRALLQRAVGNLLENALRFTPRGGRVTVEAKIVADQVVLCVCDTGVGIPDDHVPRVFDRFYRVDRARASDAGGAGLGLAIVQSIARLHGGEALIDSAAGRGTSVTLTLNMTKS